MKTLIMIGVGLTVKYQFYNEKNTWENIYFTYLKMTKSFYLERAAPKTFLDDFSGCIDS